MIKPFLIDAPAHVLGCDCETCEALDAAARELKAGLGKMKNTITRAGDSCAKSAGFLREVLGKTKRGA